MALTHLVTEGLECKLSSFYKADKALFDECLNGLPAFANCLICAVDIQTGKQELTYFLPQGEVFDKKNLIELFYKPYSYELIFFEAELEGIPVFSMPGISYMKLNSTEVMSTFISLVGFENRHSFLFKEYIVAATLEKLTLYILREMNESNNAIFEQLNGYFENERLMKIFQFVHEHLHEDITLEQLGSLINLSADYISQFFKRCVGLSIQAYLIDQRVKFGLYHLVSSNEQISVISTRTGFIDQAYFNRRFKMFYSMNPLRLRKKYQLLHISQAGVIMASPR